MKERFDDYEKRKLHVRPEPDTEAPDCRPQEKKVIMINIADLPSDIPGKTYRELNAEKEHNYSVGTLVEIIETGVRLFVVKHTRDCDQTPLYSLCHNKDDIIQQREGFGNPEWTNGWSESSLKLIE